MANLKPFIDALKAAFNDDKGFLDSNYTDIGDDDASSVVLDGEWDFAAIAYTLHEQGLLAPAPLTEEWGIWGEDDAGDWELGGEFKCREEAEQFMEKNPWTREKGGYLVRRPVHDWLPADRAEGAGRIDQ